MMLAEALVAELHARGVELRAVGDRLRYKPVSALTPADVEVLRKHKAAVIALLRAAEQPPAVALTSYAHPWPDALERLGSRRVGPFHPCARACGRWSWVRFGDTVFCLVCATREVGP
jgi:hypothetical protein